MATQLTFPLDLGCYDECRDIEEWLAIFFGDYPEGFYLPTDSAPVLSAIQPGYQFITTGGQTEVRSCFPNHPTPGYDVYESAYLAPRGQKAKVLVPGRMVVNLTTRPALPSRLLDICYRYIQHVVLVSRQWRYDEDFARERAPATALDRVGFLISLFRTAVSQRIDFNYELIGMDLADAHRAMCKALAVRGMEDTIKQGNTLSPADAVMFADYRSELGLIKDYPVNAANYIEAFDTLFTEKLEDIITGGSDFSETFDDLVADITELVMMDRYRMLEVELIGFSILLTDSGDYRVMKYNEMIEAKRAEYKETQELRGE